MQEITPGTEIVNLKRSPWSRATILEIKDIKGEMCYVARGKFSGRIYRLRRDVFVVATGKPFITAADLILLRDLKVRL